MPPSPPPQRQRKSRRAILPAPIIGTCCDWQLVNKDEFIAVKDDAAEAGQPVLAHMIGECGEFIRICFTTERVTAGRLHLRLDGHVASINAAGELLGLPQYKSVVQHR